jgi:hypothetical protein
MKRIILLLLLAVFLLPAFSQLQRPLTINDLAKWNRITEKIISNNGELAGFVIEPWEGDSSIELYEIKKDKKTFFKSSSGIAFTADSKFLTFTIKPTLEETRELKLKKTKRENMPLNMLGIYDIQKMTTDTIMRLKSFRLPAKWSGWIVWQCEPAITTKEKDKTVKKESEENGYHLCIRNLSEGTTDTIKFVTGYILAQEAPVLLCSTTGDDKNLSAGVIMINLEKKTRNELFIKDVNYKQLSLSKKADQAAFLISSDNKKDKTGNNWSLCYWNGSGKATIVAEKGNPGIPADWIINENHPLTFGEKSRRLFFGTSPEFKLKDTTMLDEEKPNVDIWHYAEGKLHTVQVIDKERDLKRAYLAVYHNDLKRTVQLGNTDMPLVQLIDKGDAAKVLALSNLPYELEKMWESSPVRYDIWLIDIISGTPKKLKTNIRANIRPSPAGKYIYWYNYTDSSFYSYELKTEKEFKLTNPRTIICYNELNDVPNIAPPYPVAGWLKDDNAFLIYDRYDIWSLDPSAKNEPVNLTLNGRKNRVTYRLININYDKEYIDPSEMQYLSAFNEVSKESAFYRINLQKPGNPEFLTGGNYSLGTPVKARNADAVIFTKETFELFPDYEISDLSFSKSKRLTDANPQQKDFLWGSSPELLTWFSLDGKEIKGLLYKPAGFDPSKKYPMIVNFYEKSSDEMYRHRIPEPHRSTIDYHYYTSNGYLVFNPDVHYVDGYPGQSAYNCVMPGIMHIIEKGFVDEKHIGAQGHSWGGYQVAYLATRSDLFAAIESGAPVVNMYSAYGGIRWETGLNRSFQYEREQSRIGATIWEAPHLYWENSPLFAIEKVSTPILIMANDKDGHVPWWQGIEFFIALRRLGKPSWLLNYTGEPHWPLKLPNKKDFQIRMSQFFGHYLKGEPMPRWMKEGIPATEKDFTYGY